MEPEVLLAQVRSLIERTPDFDQYTPTSHEHLVWLGQAHAFVSQWDRTEAMGIKVSSQLLHSETMREGSLDSIMGAVYRAMAALELVAPVAAQTTFAAGDVYDFFNELNKVISSAEASIFIVDPYLDPSVFDQYLSSRGADVTVKLLLNKDADSIQPAAEKYIQQFGSVLEVRKSKAIHDRVIFIDGYVCWITGQSLKDAAKAKPTYLVALAPDVVPAKLQSYEEIWAAATPVV